jgi:hypothetical protein
MEQALSPDAEIYRSIRCLASPFHSTLDTSKHPGLHDVMTEAGGSQHQWSRSERQCAVDSLDEDRAMG